MAIKILTQNGIDNSNIDGARAEYFNSGMRDGIVKGAFNEGTLTTSNNLIILDSCELRIGGHRIVIDSPLREGFSIPVNEPTRLMFLAVIFVLDNQQIDFFTEYRKVGKLKKDNIYKNADGRGVYEVEIGRFTLNPDGTIVDLVRTIDVITGGGSGTSNFNVGNVTTTKIDSNLEAEVDIDKRIEPETKKEYIDFKFSLPTDYSKALKKKADQIYVDENLENKISSPNTVGTTKQIKSFKEENEVLKYTTEDGDKEIKVEKPTNTPYNIMSSDWVVSEEPFKFKTTLKLARMVDDNDVVTLNINNELAKFKNYQIGATNLTSNTLDLVAEKQPMEDLKIALTIEETELLEVHPPTKELVYTLSNTGDYYIVGSGYNNIAEIESATSGGVKGNGLTADWKGGEVNIPSKHEGLPVKAIAPSAFNGIKNISKVYIADGITTIGNRCFQCAGNLDVTMTECRLPETLTYLGGMEGGRVFWGRTSLSSITIPEGTTIIGNSTFTDCRTLTSITLSNRVTSIGNNAFAECSSLNNITFKGTIEQWNAIKKEINWNNEIPAKVVHCTDGDAPIV